MRLIENSGGLAGFAKTTLAPLILFGSLLGSSCDRSTGGAPGHMELESFQAIGGDKEIYLQWSITEDGSMGGREIERLCVRRVGSGTIGAVMLYQEEGLIMPEYGTFLDTTCENDEQYGYFLEAAIIVELSLFSDTIYAKAQQGLSNPVPPSPESLVAVCEDSFFILQWKPPANHDSLYYLYRSNDAKTWFTIFFEPTRYNSPICTLRYYIENDYKYFRIACFVNGLLSLPSDSVVIVKPSKQEGK
jgi:hypothetical protein